MGTLTERIKERREAPSNVVPIVERRKTPRWVEWTREHQREGSKDLTGGKAA